MSEVFKKLINDFGVSIGINDLSTSEDNECLIGIDDYKLSIVLKDSKVQFCTSFFKIPKENENKYNARLIQGNFLLLETGGATLAVNPLSNDVQLIYCTELQLLDVSSFSNILESYVNMLDHWKNICITLEDDTLSKGQDSDIMYQMQGGLKI